MAQGPSEGSKRKRAPAGAEPVKRRKSASEESDDPNARILLIEQGILESRKNYNDIRLLLDTASKYANGEAEPVLAAVALCRIFVRLLALGTFAAARKKLSEKDQVVLDWLKEQRSRYKSMLLQMLDEEAVATTALTLSMGLLKAEGEFLLDKEVYFFPSTFLEDIVKSILLADNEELRRAYIETYAEQYDDIRFFTFQAVKSVIESRTSEDGSSGLFDRVFALMSALDGVPESAEDLDDFYIPKPSRESHPLRSVTQHKKRGRAAWLELMGLIRTKDERKRLLNITSTIIAPWFTKPELLADFLTSSYDTGGSMSLLALSGVYYLIKERNLDYPSFYPKLYSLLDRDILHSKHRSRFFRLLDTFLASTHLPAVLVASFVKRLARLALHAPPGAIVFVVPWIYNLFKRHPTCTFMLHRVVREPELQQQIKDNGFFDPFLADETDPMATRAIESCLWEIVHLQSHYHPNVATIAKIISEQFTKQSYNMEDFLDHSYASLLEAELGKDVKKAPVVEFQIPKRIFLPQTDPAAAPDSLLVRLWNFAP